MKLFGFGLALAVIMDATVIRATLVPAFVRLAGSANWWAPAPLRRFYERFGVAEAAERDQRNRDEDRDDVHSSCRSRLDNPSAANRSR
jgi:RND superfamily putative drug exporter